VIENYPQNTHRNDWGGMWIYDARYAKPRCCLTMNGDEGFGIYYEPGASIANCIATACREWSFRFEGSTEWYECAYLYSSRSRYGIRNLALYEHGLGTHDIICDAHQYGIIHIMEMLDYQFIVLDLLHFVMECYQKTLGLVYCILM
jgi:hypothetical protein